MFVQHHDHDSGHRHHHEEGVHREQHEQHQRKITQCMEQIALAEKALTSARQVLRDVASLGLPRLDGGLLPEVSANVEPLVPSSTTNISPTSPTKSTSLELTANSQFLHIDQIIASDVEIGSASQCEMHSRNHRPPRSRFLFDPAGVELATWRVFGIVFIVYEAFAVPFEIALSPKVEGIYFIFVSVVNAYFIIDIFITFRTCYISSTGALVVSKRLIAKRYIKSWFIPDLVSGIPWEWLSLDVGPARVTKAIRLLRISRLVRLLKMRSLFPTKVEIAIEDSAMVLFIYGVIKVFILLIGITHWCACGWYMVGNRDDPNGQTWLHKYVPEGDKMQGYFYACFFALTTMTTVGYGDITAQNPSEVGFTIFLLLVAAIIFPVILGSIADMVSTLGSDQRLIHERTQTLVNYLQWRKIPPSLFHSIREHLKFLWDVHKNYAEYEGEVMAQLPPVLRQELCYHKYSSALRSAPFLSWMKDVDVCCKALSLLVETVFMAKGDLVLRVGEPNTQVYMLMHGGVHISLNENLANIQHNPEEDAESEEGEVDSQQGEILNSRLMPEVMTAFHTEAMKRKRETRSTNDVCNTSFGLERAMNHLQDRFQEQQEAATHIARIWRAKQSRRADRIKAPSTAKHARSHIKSKAVWAPSYFGESCLWDQFDTWDSPNHSSPTYAYNVRCDTRVELIRIPRSAVKQLIDRFSPWLRNRFELFRVAMVKSHLPRLSEKQGEKLDVDTVSPHDSDRDIQAHGASTYTRTSDGTKVPFNTIGAHPSSADASRGLSSGYNISDGSIRSQPSYRRMSSGYRLSRSSIPLPGIRPISN
eukprot:TRINITY_DN4909_c0_g1_i1.p1 TRINITY_DN4909_c0_g1~~TRINITY_DN4909_c0_g1_i1.p1  ORF type:complete len:817 (-),score=88.67 TRINITY_DN4909_c0_g1_i1:67-2517(-)